MNSWLLPAWLHTDQAVFLVRAPSGVRRAIADRHYQTQSEGPARGCVGNTAVRWRLKHRTHTHAVYTHRHLKMYEQMIRVSRGFRLIKKHRHIHASTSRETFKHNLTQQKLFVKGLTVSDCLGANWKFSFLTVLHIKLSWLLCLRSQDKTKQSLLFSGDCLLLCKPVIWLDEHRVILFINKAQAPSNPTNVWLTISHISQATRKCTAHGKQEAKMTGFAFTSFTHNSGNLSVSQHTLHTSAEAWAWLPPTQAGLYISLIWTDSCTGAEQTEWHW